MIVQILKKKDIIECFRGLKRKDFCDCGSDAWIDYSLFYENNVLHLNRLCANKTISQSEYDFLKHKNEDFFKIFLNEHVNDWLIHMCNKDEMINAIYHYIKEIVNESCVGYYN